MATDWKIKKQNVKLSYNEFGFFGEKFYFVGLKYDLYSQSPALTFSMH